jgi:hypothetical protein
LLLYGESYVIVIQEVRYGAVEKFDIPRPTWSFVGDYQKIFAGFLDEAGSQSHHPLDIFA